MRTITSILLVVLWAGCASAPDSLKERNLSMVSPGMGKDDVISLLGQPTTVEKPSPNTEKWIWSKGAFSGNGESPSVLFTNGIVANVMPGL